MGRECQGFAMSPIVSLSPGKGGITWGLSPRLIAVVGVDRRCNDELSANLCANSAEIKLASKRQAKA